MSELQIGDQQSKPVDTTDMLRKADAAIDGQFKQQISTFAGAMQVLKGSSDNNNPLADLSSGGGAYDHAAAEADRNKEVSSDSLFAGKMSRKKGSKSIKDLQATTDAMGHRISRGKMRRNQAILNAAWTDSRHIKDKDGGSGSSRDEGLIEEMALLRTRLAIMPIGLKQNPSLLPGVGLGHIYEAITAINKEKDDPATAAVISGTANDMDGFKDKFKTLDAGLQEQVYAAGSSEMKKKVAPLMSQ